MDVEFKIEKNIPCRPRGLKAAKYPWGQMEPGDSFYVSLDGRDSVRVQQSVSSSGRAVFGKGNIRSRKEGDGIRCWRLA